LASKYYLEILRIGYILGAFRQNRLGVHGLARKRENLGYIITPAILVRKASVGTVQKMRKSKWIISHVEIVEEDNVGIAVKHLTVMNWNVNIVM
jgi:hypothetical protein